MRAIPCSDVWFDTFGAPGRQCSVLRFAMPVEMPAPPEFWTRLMAPDGPLVRFRRIVVTRGRQVFEATEWRSGDEPAPASSAPLWLISGPPRRGPQDAP